MAGSPQEPLRGHLWKRSPSKLKFYKYQWRFVVIDGGKLYWWRNADTYHLKGVAGCCGFVDLKLNCCKVQIDVRHPCRFSLVPGFLSWHRGQFTGADACRIFEFDASESEFSRETWMKEVECHAQTRRASQAELVHFEPASSFSKEAYSLVVALSADSTADASPDTAQDASPDATSMSVECRPTQTSAEDPTPASETALDVSGDRHHGGFAPPPRSTSAAPGTDAPYVVVETEKPVDDKVETSIDAGATDSSVTRAPIYVSETERVVEDKVETSNDAVETNLSVIIGSSSTAGECPAAGDAKAETSIDPAEADPAVDLVRNGIAADEGPASGDAKAETSIDPAEADPAVDLVRNGTAAGEGPAAGDARLATRKSLVNFSFHDEVVEVPRADASGSDSDTADDGPLTFCMQDSEPAISDRMRANSLEARYDALGLLAKAAAEDLSPTKVGFVPDSAEVYEIYDADLSSDDGGGGPESDGEEDDNLRHGDLAFGKESTLLRHYDALDCGHALGTVAANETESFSEGGTVFSRSKSEAARGACISPRSALQVARSLGRAFTEGSALSQANPEA